MRSFARRRRLRLPQLTVKAPQRRAQFVKRSSRESIPARNGRLEFCYSALVNYVYQMTIPSAISQPTDAGALAYPGLERRTALRDRRPLALRRHTARRAPRFAVLVTGDVIGIVLARALALWLNADTLRGAEAFDSGLPFGSSPLVTGGRRMVFLAIMT